MKNILKYFKNTRRNTAVTAKERLQIIISHERTKRQYRDGLLTQLQNELLQVIAKYFKVDPEQIKEHVKVDVEQAGGNSVLELNIVLPELAESANEAAPATEGAV